MRHAGPQRCLHLFALVILFWRLRSDIPHQIPSASILLLEGVEAAELLSPPVVRPEVPPTRPALPADVALTDSEQFSKSAAATTWSLDFSDLHHLRVCAGGNAQ